LKIKNQIKKFGANYSQIEIKKLSQIKIYTGKKKTEPNSVLNAKICNRKKKSLTELQIDYYIYM
jgi:hypothetical protein